MDAVAFILQVDPTVDGWQMPVGTLGYSVVTESLYVKEGDGATEWAVSGGGSGTVASVSGDGVDNTDPANPVIDLTGVVTNADLANMTAHTAKVRKTNSSGPPEDASMTELTALLDAATTSLPGLMSAADKTKINAIYRPKVGTALTDADQTIQAGTDKVSEYVQSTTLTANRTKTMGITSVSAGTLVRIVRADSAAKTLAIVNGGTNGGTLFTFAASPTEVQGVTVLYNGIDWVLAGFEYLTVS